MGRFINADSYASTGQGILGNNMFAYSLNNPVQYSDDDGCKVDWKKVAMVAASVVEIVAGTAMIATGVGGIGGGTLLAMGVSSLVGGIMNEGTIDWEASRKNGVVSGSIALLATPFSAIPSCVAKEIPKLGASVAIAVETFFDALAGKTSEILYGIK